ncbi:hypothetical protein ACFSTH_00040 [Paenibacillus yanchengensis]
MVDSNEFGMVICSVIRKVGVVLKEKLQQKRSKSYEKNGRSKEASERINGATYKQQAQQAQIGHGLSMLQIQQLQYCNRGLSWRYAQIVEQLFARSNDSQLMLWRQFSTLSVEQRQAALHYAAGSMQHLEQLLHSEHWFTQMEQAVQQLQHVQLQAQESMKEANIYESGAVEQYPLVHWQLDLPGLIAPYREIMQWLMYKAIKQGEVILLQQILNCLVECKSCCYIDWLVEGD